MHARLGDRVASIATHNEPWVMSVLGHETGIFAPGIKHRATAMQVAHHLMLSHGMALRALRDVGCKASLGIVLNLSPIEPATDSAADQAQARLEDGRLVRWYMDPLFKGAYPADVLEHLQADSPVVQAGDMEIIQTPMDFLGINYYSRSVASAGEPWNVHQSGLEVTDMDWEVYPQGLTALLLRLHQDYAVPAMFITENGGAFKDPLVNGQVHDADRTRYLQTHIEAVHKAMAQGVNMGGYMVWSLMDNFEWASGYAKRFGIVHVDYATQKRTLKDSARWYQSFLAQQAAAHLAYAA
jgi:beta-glucosidase